MEVNTREKEMVFTGEDFEGLIKKIEETYPNYKGMHTSEKRVMPWFWKKRYEVKVMVEKEEEKEEIKIQNSTNGSREGEKPRSILGLLEEKGNLIEQQKKNSPNISEGKSKDLNVSSQEQSFEDFASELAWDSTKQKLYEKDFDFDVVERIMKRAKREEDYPEDELIKEIISDFTKVKEGFDPNVDNIIALIGSTGVGKTTTIAKLGGYLKKKGKKVGFITTDVYRMGATDQLESYADIMQSEMRAVNSPEELAIAIEELREENGVDNVLIDTVGRSPLDLDMIEEAKKYLKQSNPDKIYFVFSSTQKSQDIFQTMKNFEDVNIDSLIFTKIDETTVYGTILNAMVKGGLPVSYITNGQNVPQDIYEVGKNEMVNKIYDGVEDFGPNLISK